MKTTIPTNLVSTKFLARTFHQLPDQLVERLRSLGVEPIAHLDGVAYFRAEVVEQLRASDSKPTKSARQ